MLAWQGYVLQAGILDQISAFKVLVIIFIAVGICWAFLKYSIDKKLVDIGIYVVIVLVLWSLLGIRSGIDVRFAPPPEEKAFASNVTGTIEVNWLFAYTVGLINKIEQTAINIIGKVSSLDGYARNYNSLVEGAFGIIDMNLNTEYISTKDKIEKNKIKDTRKILNDFLKEDGTINGGNIGCSKLWKKAYAEADKTNPSPWYYAISMATAEDTSNSTLKEGYGKYKEVLAKYKDEHKEQITDLSRIIECQEAPELINKILYGNLADKIASPIIEGTAIKYGTSAGQHLWKMIEGTGVKGHQIKTMLLKKPVQRHFEKTRVVNRSHKISSYLMGALVNIEEKFGILSGTKKVLSAIKFMPYVRGVVRTILYAIFPFFILFAFLPNGLRWLGHYYKFIFAVSVWSIMDVIIISTIDAVYWGQLMEFTLKVTNIDYSPDALAWAQGVAMSASPIASFMLVNATGRGMFGADQAGEGPGGIKTVISTAATAARFAK